MIALPEQKQMVKALFFDVFGTQILSFDERRIHEVIYDQIPATQIVRRSLNDRKSFLESSAVKRPRCSKENASKRTGDLAAFPQTIRIFRMVFAPLVGLRRGVVF
jgi:hypothetical protein